MRAGVAALVLLVVLGSAFAGTAYDDNPFSVSMAGFLGDNTNVSLGAIKSVRAGSVRFMSRWGGMHWSGVERVKGVYDWSNTDGKFAAATKLGLCVIVTVYPDNPSWQADSDFPQDYPNDMPSYLAFVKAAAERYDGDGFKDASGHPKVNVWGLLEELERGMRDGTQVDMVWWGGTAKEYADLFVQTYRAVRQSDSQAAVMPAGVNVLGHVIGRNNMAFTEGVLKAIRASPLFSPSMTFVYPLHYYSSPSEYTVDELAAAFAAARKMLAESGFGSTPLAINDFGMFMGNSQPESVKEHAAANMVVSYAYTLAHKVKPLGWAQTSDGAWGNSIEVGLISKDPSGTWAWKYNALYYSYGLMASKLAGSDLSKTVIVSEGQNEMYAYKFVARGTGKSVYLVSWRKPMGSSQTSKTVLLKTLGIGTKVQVTEAVTLATWDASGQVVVGDHPLFLDPVK